MIIHASLKLICDWINFVYVNNFHFLITHFVIPFLFWLIEPT